MYNSLIFIIGADCVLIIFAIYILYTSEISLNKYIDDIERLSKAIIKVNDNISRIYYKINNNYDILENQISELKDNILKYRRELLRYENNLILLNE